MDTLDLPPAAGASIEEIVEAIFGDLLTLRPTPVDDTTDRRQRRLLDRIAGDIDRLLAGNA